jgi:hypothetical protein
MTRYNTRKQYIIKHNLKTPMKQGEGFIFNITEIKTFLLFDTIEVTGDSMFIYLIVMLYII